MNTFVKYAWLTLIIALYIGVYVFVFYAAVGAICLLYYWLYPKWMRHVEKKRQKVEA